MKRTTIGVLLALLLAAASLSAACAESLMISPPIRNLPEEAQGMNVQDGEIETGGPALQEQAVIAEGLLKPFGETLALKPAETDIVRTDFPGAEQLFRKDLYSAPALTAIAEGEPAEAVADDSFLEGVQVILAINLDDMVSAEFLTAVKASLSEPVKMIFEGFLSDEQLRPFAEELKTLIEAEKLSRPEEDQNLLDFDPGLPVNILQPGDVDTPTA